MSHALYLEHSYFNGEQISETGRSLNDTVERVCGIWEALPPNVVNFLLFPRLMLLKGHAAVYSASALEGMA